MKSIYDNAFPVNKQATLAMKLVGRGELVKARQLLVDMEVKNPDEQIALMKEFFEGNINVKSKNKARRDRRLPSDH